MQPEQVHIVLNNADCSSGSTWNACSVPEPSSETMMTANANIVTGVMNRNRLTTSNDSAFDSSATVSEISDDSSFACTLFCFTDGSARDVSEKLDGV